VISEYAKELPEYLTFFGCFHLNPLCIRSAKVIYDTNDTFDSVSLITVIYFIVDAL
jgi:hypothetical protein